MYKEINKILVDIDTPYFNWSEEDNKIRSKFLHSINNHAIANMSIPKKIKYYTWFLQKVKNAYKTNKRIF